MSAALETSALRPLYLPERDTSTPADNNRRGVPVSATAAIKPAEERYAQTDSLIIIGRGGIDLRQLAANLSYPPRGGTAQPARQKLADEVVGFLLTANEVDHDAARAAPPAGPVLARYQNAAAGFPAKGDSLFSLAG